MYHAKVVNPKTGEQRDVKVTLAQLTRATLDGVDRCVGPCRCRVEPDGICPKGWVSGSVAVGVC